MITKIKELRGSDLRVQKERKEKTIIIIKLSYIIPMWQEKNNIKERKGGRQMVGGRNIKEKRKREINKVLQIFG